MEWLSDMIADYNSGNTAQKAYSKGEYIVTDAGLKKALTDIEISETISEQNSKETTVGDELYSQDQKISELGDGYTEASNHVHPVSLFDVTSTYNLSSSATSIYFSDEVIPANSLVTKLIACSGTVGAGKAYVVDASTHIVKDIIPVLVSTANSYETIYINKTYDSDVLIGFGDKRWKYKTSSTKGNETYSTGLVEANISGGSPAIGDALSIKNVTSLYYCFALQIYWTSYEFTSFKSIIAENEKNSKIVNSCQKWQPIGLQLNNALLRYANTDNEVEYVGRWYPMAVNGIKCMVTNNCGAELYFKASGATAVTLNWIPMTETNAYFVYQVDGGEYVRQAVEDGSISLPDTGNHVVRVITDGITENIGKWANGTGFALSGVSVGTGSINGLMPMNPQIMFFGDSIVEGIMALGSSTDMGDTNSATGAFPWFCCEKMGAVSFRVGYGATGVISSGSFHPAIDALNYLYSTLKVPEYYPDAIVIEHGTNDSSASSESFTTAYKNFLDAIKVKYSGIRVYLFVPLNQTHASDIASIAEEYTWCKLIDTAGWYSGLHPSKANAKIIGERLADVLISDIYGTTLTN